VPAAEDTERPSGCEPGIPARSERDQKTEPRLATVVIGDDAGAVGRAVVELEARGWRAAGFVGDPARQREALVEMLAELFTSPSAVPVADID
jgi:hypothetical protein